MEINNKQQSRRIMKRYQRNPLAFFTECLDVHPENIWDKMEETVNSVRDYQRTAVKAGHAVSKTYTAARLVLWFLLCHYPSTVITTAPSYTLVEQQLWRELRDAYTNAKVPLGGKLTLTQLDLSNKWFAYGFSTRPDTAQKEATRAQGYHNKYVLVLFDEASGIMKKIWEAAESLIIDDNCRFLAIGNPLLAGGDFSDCFKDSDYNKITISVKDTPNYKQDRQIIPGVSGRTYERNVAKKHGVESNYYKARVLGLIPEEDIDAIIHTSWVDQAYRQKIIGQPIVRRFVAGDPADGGDESVFYYMEGTDIKDEMIFQKKNTMITAGMVNIFAKKHKTNNYVGDSIGIGKGICDRLSEMGMNVVYVNSAQRQASGVPDIYYNRRSEVWCNAGEEFSMGNVVLSHKDEVLREQLTKVKQTVRNGRILIVSKDEIRKDLGRSPDRADAYVIGLWGRKKIPLFATKSQLARQEKTNLAESYTVESVL